MIFQSVRWFPLISLFVYFMAVSPGYSQVEKAKEYHPNGQVKYKGKYIKCTTHENKYPYITNYEKRKFGKWIYYYPSGVVAEIKNYTKKVRRCDIAIFKEGEWKYFNEDGVLYRTEQYNNDTLIYSEIEIFEHKSLIGKIILSKQSGDTLFYISKDGRGNLIPNPSFDQYFFKPVSVINKGKNQIEELIPYWHSPDMATPDYYHQYRGVAGIPEHFETEPEEKETNGYIGLLLYRGRKRAPQGSLLSHEDKEPEYLNDYKESIQSKLVQRLKKGKHYCFQAKIALSQNAGYHIDRFEVLFTENAVRYSYEQSPGIPTLSFSNLEISPKLWMPICKAFTASGNEAYITLGRFSSLDELSVNPLVPEKHSELDINRSAYYLLDDLELFEVASLEACGCRSNEGELKMVADNAFEETNLEKVIEGKRYILNSIRFDLDKSVIKNSFIPELERLLSYLENNPSAHILILGHTDNAGTEFYNQELSSERAEKVREWLINNGIEETRIDHKGLGDKFPLLENTSEASRIINRRVEFEIVTVDD
ncbi:OmpA/MotB protein [Flammeovirgaceae bacterium 311]|nr:OmpA/MotB protein [Flammeovirgaceae bacterium 311]